MPNEKKSDDALAQRLEEILDDEHELRLIWARATGLTYDDAVKAFNDAKDMAVLDLVTEAITARNTKVAAAECTCPMGWFPADRDLQLRAQPHRPGVFHHHDTCAKSFTHA